MKILCCSLLALLLAQSPLVRTACSASPSEQPITVAVFNFTSNVGRVLPKDVTSLVTAGLSADPRLSLVERAQLTKTLREQALGLSGNIDFGAAAKVGELTGAKVLVSGRAMKLRGNLVLVADIIGTETSRAYSEKVQGPATNLVALTSNLCQQISQTIAAQATNFVGATAPSRQKLIDNIVETTKGKHRPTVSVEIKETIAGEPGPHQTAQNELGMIFQQAGFAVLDERSDMRPEVLVTGTAVADGGARSGNLFSCQATFEIQARERKTNKVLFSDRRRTAVSDIGRQTAARLALEKAADELAERLLPALAQ